jgi:hypothetical protein
MENEGIQTETPVVETPKLASQRITELSTDVDFGLPPEQNIDYVMKDYTMTLSPELSREMIRNSGIQSSFGEQVSTGIQGILAGLSMLPDQASIAYGNLTNYFSGGKIGEELQNVAFDSLQKRMADIGYNEEAIGGVNNWLAQLVTGGASFMELALVSMATAGVGGLAQIVTQEMGEGFYNDMQAYLDIHGSLDGYKPKGSDVALNVANTILQAGIEAWQGVASPRFLTGWSRGLWKEGVAGFGQEFAQGALSDFNEFLKGNTEAQDLIEQSDQWIRDGIVGGILQGTLGAATYGTARRKHDILVARAHAMSKGRKEPNKEDMDIAKKLGDLKEQGYGSAFAEEFKKRFDATSPVGQLQQKVATAINDAAKAQNLDMGLSETQLAQRIESIAAQETMNAMEDSAERRQSISAHELNNITYKDGALWLAGTTPEVGTRSINLAKVLEQRQGLISEPEKSVAVKAKKTKLKTPANALSAVTDPSITGEPKAKGTPDEVNQNEQKKVKDRADDLRMSLKEAGYGNIKYKWTKNGEPANSYYFVVNDKTIRVSAHPSDKTSYDFWLDYRKGLDNNIQELQNYLSDETLKQSRPGQSRLDKGDTYRGAYDEKLKRIILNEKSDLTTIQHEFAHYWIQNNFRWYRSGLASDDWKHNWERVEQALGIEPTDKYLSKVASEKFARAYERYIMEGKVAPEYQWAFAEFQEFYNEVYDGLKAEYFDLNEELSPELIDWFNRQRPVAPEQVAEMRQNQIRSAIAQSPDNTVVEKHGDSYSVISQGENGEIESAIFVPRETVEKEKFGVARKMTKSGLQESLRKRFGDEINVDDLVSLNSAETLAEAEELIATNPKKAWEQMLSDSTNNVIRGYLYKAFVRMAENDPQIAIDLSHTNMAEYARELGQTIQAFNIEDELGLSPIKLLKNIEKAKGTMTEQQLAQALNEIDLYAELSAEDTTSLENETECLL